MATKKKSKSTMSGAEIACSPCRPYKQTAEDKKREAEWRAEEDARTLIRADEIRKDPARLKGAKAYAKKRADELAGITSITD